MKGYLFLSSLEEISVRNLFNVYLSIYFLCIHKYKGIQLLIYIN